MRGVSAGAEYPVAPSEADVEKEPSRGSPMNRFWLKSYPPGVPAEIDHARLTSVAELLRQACSDYRDRPAFEQMGRAITFGQLDELSRDFAAWLQSVGMVKGDRLAIMLPNTLQYPIALFGARQWRTGRVGRPWRIGGHEACRAQVAGTRLFLGCFRNKRIRAAVRPPDP